MPKQQCQAGNTSQQEDLEGLARDVLRKRGILIIMEELVKIRQFLESNAKWFQNNEDRGQDWGLKFFKTVLTCKKIKTWIDLNRR